jgi:tol-pal system protein YbgF
VPFATPATFVVSSHSVNQRPVLAHLRSAGALAALLALTSLAAFTPAHAGLFDDDEARKQIISLRNQLAETQKTLDARVGELESQARNRSIIDLFNQVETLRTEFARLRGQIELIQNELETTQKRQRDLYVDLDGRMRKIEAQQQAADQARAAQAAAPTGGIAGAIGGAPPVAGFAPPTPTMPSVDPSRSAPPATFGGQGPAAADPAAEQRAYDQGLDHFRAGRFAEAVTAFQIFMRSYSRSPLASSAQYWIGNSLYATRDFKGSIAAQRQLLSLYPESPKAPDAMLNVASSYAELGDVQGARTTLQEVTTKYPSSEAAAKARQRLGVR